MPTLQFTEGGSEPPSQLEHRKQLLNHLVDGMASVRPESVWAKIPRDSFSYEAGYRKVTYKLMANAVNGLAWWIEDNFGRSKSFETLAYFGGWDPRYVFLLLAAVKVGYKMLFPSMLWSGPGLTQLLDRLGCETILVSSTDLPIIPTLENEMQRQVKEIPSLATLLETQYKHYPFDKKFDEAKSEPLVVVHTSGTTGIPKPLIYTHDWAASWILQNQMDPPPGSKSLEHVIHGVELCAVTPPNHMSNFLPNFFGAIPNQIVVIYPLPQSPLSLNTAIEMIRHNNPDLLIAPSFILDGLAVSTELMQEISSKISMIGYGGGPLPKHNGDTLARTFTLLSLYGTSEIGTLHKVVPTDAPKPPSWNSMKPHSGENIQFRHLHYSSFEAVVVRNDSSNQPAFKLFPDQHEWPTKDVFTPDPDPDLPGFWIYQGRVDDFLILSNGSTVSPLGFEQRLAQHPSIKGALMCGTGRIQPALLVELAAVGDGDVPDVDAGIDDALWSLVEACNELFPPQASIARSHIILTAPEKPLPRSAKGTVQRSRATEIYLQELDNLYGTVGQRG